MDALTRQNRYEGRWSLVNGGGMISRQLEFTQCMSCGALVALGALDLHESLHPAALEPDSAQGVGC